MKEGESRLNRRNFLKGMGTMWAGSVLAFGGGTLYKKSQGILEKLTDTGVDDEDLRNAKKFLLDTYGIEVTSGETWDPAVFGTPLSREKQAGLLKGVILEMGKYPLDFFKKNQLRRLHLMGKLEVGPFYKAKEASGLYSQFYAGDIFLTSGSAFQSIGEIFHHELVHLLDYHDEGHNADNQRWIEIQQQCQCGLYGNNEPHAVKYIVTDGAFASRYGSTNPEEDKADLGAIMMDPNKHRELLTIMQGAPQNEQKVLRAKYDDMKAKYLRWSGSRMDEKYWKQLLATAKAPDYTSDTKSDSYFTDYIGPAD